MGIFPKIGGQLISVNFPISPFKKLANKILLLQKMMEMICREIWKYGDMQILESAFNIHHVQFQYPSGRACGEPSHISCAKNTGQNVVL